MVSSEAYIQVALYWLRSLYLMICIYMHLYLYQDYIYIYQDYTYIYITHTDIYIYICNELMPFTLELILELFIWQDLHETTHLPF